MKTKQQEGVPETVLEKKKKHQKQDLATDGAATTAGAVGSVSDGGPGAASVSYSPSFERCSLLFVGRL